MQVGSESYTKSENHTLSRPKHITTMRAYSMHIGMERGAHHAKLDDHVAKAAQTHDAQLGALLVQAVVHDGRVGGDACDRMNYSTQCVYLSVLG